MTIKRMEKGSHVIISGILDEVTDERLPLLCFSTPTKEGKTEFTDIALTEEQLIQTKDAISTYLERKSKA